MWFPEIKLNEPFRVDQLPCPGHLNLPMLDWHIWLPTETIAASPKVQMCRVARVYCLNLWLDDGLCGGQAGVAMDYESLHRAPDFKGTSDYDPVYLCEVYQDGGDDGHMDMWLWGFQYVNGRDFERAYKETDGVVKGPLTPFIRNDLTGW